jgi:hypothetical protein
VVATPVLAMPVVAMPGVSKPKLEGKQDAPARPAKMCVAVPTASADDNTHITTPCVD